MGVDMEEPGRRRLSGCWMFAPACVLLLALLAIALWVWDAALKRKLDARIADAHARGEPVTFAEFMERRRQAAPFDCSALSFMDAMERLQLVDGEDHDRTSVIARLRFSEELGARRSDEQRAMMRGHVEARAEVLALIRQGARLPPGAYPIDASGPPWCITMDHLARTRHIARLCRRAAVLHAEDGDGRAAAEYTADGLALAASVGEWPLLIERLVDLAIGSIALDGLERALAVCEMPADSLTMLREALRQAEDGNRTLAALLAERAGGHWALVEASADDVAEFVRTCGDGIPGVLARLYAVAPVWRAGDALFYHKVMERQVDAHRLPLEERAQAAARASQQAETDVAAGGMRHPLSAMTMPALSRAGEEDVKAAARSRVVRVALAAEQWRMMHGDWPESLDQLVPEFLDALPCDPHTGGPLLWKRTPEGFTVYSAGLDGDDNGGLRQQDAAAVPGNARPPYDIPFRLFDPERRGARTRAFRDEVMEAGWLNLSELAPFGFDEARLRTLRFTDEDLRTLRNRE